MKKKIFLAAALAAVTLLAACGEPEEKPAGNNTGTNHTATPAITAAPTAQPAQPTAEPAASTPTEVPASNTAAPASNTAAPTSVPASNTPVPASTATPKPADIPKPAETPKPVQTASDFDAIAGSWYSSANNRHGNLSLQISSDGSSSLGTLAYDGNDSYHVAGTTTTLSLEKWADGSERLYVYDTYTYEDATYIRSN